MTVDEKAVCTAYTGINFCDGEEFRTFHKYAENLLGRPVQTMELATKEIWNDLKTLSKDDFHKIVIGEEIKI